MLLAAPASAFHSKNPSREFQIDSGEGDQYQGFDPMETSIPYVAWRGEEIRLVKCFDPEYFEPSPTGDPFEGGLTIRDPITGLITLVNLEPNETGEWEIMDWSGDAHVWPKFFDDNDQQTQVFFPGRDDDQFSDVGDQDGRGCFAIDITSHKPGIAIVKLKVDDEGEADSGVGDGVQGEGDPVAVHQFNVIWMGFQDVRLRNLEGGEGEAVGPITENPRDSNRLGVVVQGRIPLNDEFREELGLPADIRERGALIFPEDYPALARTPLAHTSYPLFKANNGIEGDDNFNNRSCDDLRNIDAPSGTPANNDQGSLADPDPAACDTDVNDPPFEGALDARYIPEPRHAPGDFWDIHDSTGPYNVDRVTDTNVYGADKPRIVDICPGPETEDHDHACHVDQHDADDPPPNRPIDDTIEDSLGRGGDASCDNSQPAGGGGPNGNDTVDNCDDGEWDAFSRVFHDVSGEDDEDEPTIGPYSPTRPDETLLSDSVLNAHDAPMPAALVIASITPNQGGSDIGGVGSLVADVDKHLVYNRGGENCTPPTGDPENEHCVTGPFSGAYIPPSPTMQNDPATVPDAQNQLLEDDRDVASGIHGSIANNFNGYLPVYYPARETRLANRGLYHYWDLVEVLRTAVPTELPDPCDDFSTPEGDQEIALYTDEHGEAQFTFEAGEGFFGAAFIVDRVQESCRPRDLLGTAEITVNARYPFQPVTSAGATSNRLLKRIESLFDKGIVCVPKPGEEDDKAICIVFARDFAGNPIDDETVCVNAEGQTAAAGNVGDVADLNNESDSKESGDNEVCVELDSPTLPAALAELLEEYEGPCDLPDLDALRSYGWEAVVIDGEGALEATADFIEENLEFSCDFSIPPAGATTGASVGSSGGSLATGGSPAVAKPSTSPATSGAQAGGASSQGPLVSSQPESKSNPAAKRPAAAKRATTLVFVRIVRPLKLGTVRYVVLRVKSPQQQARVQIKLIGKRGKSLGTLLRKVKTNRTITVPQLKLPKAVVTVRAKVIA